MIGTFKLDRANGVSTDCGKYVMFMPELADGTIMPVFQYDGRQYRLENINESGFVPLASPVAFGTYEKSILADDELLRLMLDAFVTFIAGK